MPKRPLKDPAEKLTAGRPIKQPGPETAEIVRTAAAAGATKLGVAIAAGVGIDVFTRWLEDFPELKAAFNEGREKERSTLHTRLYDLAMSNDKQAMVAAMFLLKARHGYREGEQEAAGNRVSINFTLPGAMKPTEFVQEVPHARIE